MRNLTFQNWNFRQISFRVYLCISLVLYINGTNSQAEINTTVPVPVSLTTVKVDLKDPPLETVGHVRPAKCRQRSFFHADGLYRYFECCADMLPTECYEECPCLYGGYCDFSTKTCRCPAGKTGDYCAQDCDKGYYGVACVEMCTCAEEAACDGVNGFCSCPAGNNCIRCMTGLYGPTCKIPCMCGVGIHCDENGDCLQESDDSSNEVVVVLGVILGLLIIIILIILVYLILKNRKDRRKYDYVGVNSSGDIPFDIGIGRDSVDLLESPLQAPRDLSGLMKYLNDREQAQQGYSRQTSSMETRELPNIPEIDTSEHTFLASDGTLQPVVEPISPTLTSDPSFDVPDHDMQPSCDAVAEAPSDDVPTPPPTTNQITPAPININQITTPHIVINYSHEAGSDHGTPKTSPSGSASSVHANGTGYIGHHSLPINRPFRSLSSPGYAYYKDKSCEDYDQLDRTLRKTSFTSGASSACESGSENSYNTLPLRQHRRTKKSSLKRKRHSLDKLVVKSRNSETDTESDQTPSMPTKPPRNFPRLSLGEKLRSSSGSSDHMMTSSKQSPKGSPTKSPLSLSDTDDAEKTNPYMITHLRDCKPQNEDIIGGDKKRDYGYAKPTAKRKRDKRPLNHDSFVLSINNKSSESSDEEDSKDKEDHLRTRTDDYEIPIAELRKPSDISRDDNTSSDGHDGEETLDPRTPMLQHVDHSPDNKNVRTRVDDYETPMEYLGKQPRLDGKDNLIAGLRRPCEGPNNVSSDEEETLDQRTPMLQETENATKNGDVRRREDGYGNETKQETPPGGLGGNGDDDVGDGKNETGFIETASSRVGRVDDYETPMAELMKPPAAE